MATKLFFEHPATGITKQAPIGYSVTTLFFGPLSMKIDFEPPTRDMRLEIWHKLIPEKMPLSKDVTFEDLSRERLTGGEIKNVILNSARIALKRNSRTKVRKADFMEAIQMEKQGSWSRSHERFGFRAKSDVG